MTAPSSPLRATAEGVTLAVRAQPGARRTAIAGKYGNELKVAVQAPPVEGRANDALIQFFSNLFAVPRSRIRLVSGELSRSKVFALQGIPLAAAESVLAPHLK